MQTKYEKAIALFDQANSEDPNIETWNGKTYPKELLYAQRMTDRLNFFDPKASEALKLAVRCQHICRWQIPRDSYEMNRKGYLTWRSDLSKFHAKTASEILDKVGFDEEFINEVTFLLKKKQLKKNKDTQILEDVICLVFLDYYFENFSEKYSEEKLIDILKKTWAKMSEKGHDEAMKIQFSKSSVQLIQKALA